MMQRPAKQIIGGYDYRGYRIYRYSGSFPWGIFHPNTRDWEATQECLTWAKSIVEAKTFIDENISQEEKVNA